MARIRSDDGDYLVLAGPVGNAPVSYRVYHWSGTNTVAEIGALDADGQVRALCEIPPPSVEPAAKAEGLHVLKTDEGKVDFLVVYDSAPDGGATRFECPLGGS